MTIRRRYIFSQVIEEKFIRRSYFQASTLR